MQLIYYPNTILTIPCKVTDDSEPGQSHEDKVSLTTAMWKIMDDHGGVGLAAPQVGLNVRMFIWKPVQENKKNGIIKAIWNPILTITSKNKAFGKEGCLSFPGVSVTIKRPIQSILSGININGKPIKIHGGLTATRIWAHEIDHLNGKLIIDKMDRSNTIANRVALRTLVIKHRDQT